MDWVRQIFCGICIGAADLVPGISGGTMALVLGIYEDLIFSLKTFASPNAFFLISFRWNRFHQAVSWDFLLGILIGAMISLVLLSQGIHHALSHPVYRKYLFAFFLGMILCSAWLCCYQVNAWKRISFAFLAIGIAAAYLLTGLKVESSNERPLYHVFVSQGALNTMQIETVKNYNSKTQELLFVSQSQLKAMLARGVVSPTTAAFETKSATMGRVGDFAKMQTLSFFDPWLIICGVIAVSAMLLPGISGSYLLTILGSYHLVIGSLADFFKEGDYQALLVVANLGIGIVFGALIFSKAICFFLNFYHDITLALLIGFMVGSLPALWPYRFYEYVLDPLRIHKGALLVQTDGYLPSLLSAEAFIGTAMTAFGFLIVFFLDRFSKKETALYT